MHHKKKQCDTSKVTKKVKDILVKAKTYWFPPDVVVAKVVPKRTKKQKNPKGILHIFLFYFLKLNHRSNYLYTLNYQKKVPILLFFFGKFCTPYTLVKTYTFIKTLKISNE